MVVVAGWRKRDVVLLPRAEILCVSDRRQVVVAKIVCVRRADRAAVACGVSHDACNLGPSRILCNNGQHLDYIRATMRACAPALEHPATPATRRRPLVVRGGTWAGVGVGVRDLALEFLICVFGICIVYTIE